MISKLDYCNSLLYDIPNYQRDKLQRIQNTGARMIRCPQFWPHNTYINKEPVGYLWKQGLTLRFFLSHIRHIKSWMDNLLGIWNLWLRNIIYQEHYDRHPVRSLLCTPAIKSKTYGGRAFSTAAPQIWNTVSQNMSKMQTVLLDLKQNLKHFYSGNISTDFYA